jgi:hypothetical protein
MNVHYGQSPGLFSKEQVVGWHVEVLSPLCEEAAGVGITIVLEHIPHGGSEQLENIVAIMEKVPLLRFHLDSGHAKLERGYDRWDKYLDLNVGFAHRPQGMKKGIRLSKMIVTSSHSESGCHEDIMLLLRQVCQLDLLDPVLF